MHWNCFLLHEHNWTNCMSCQISWVFKQQTSRNHHQQLFSIKVKNEKTLSKMVKLIISILQKTRSGNKSHFHCISSYLIAKKQSFNFWPVIENPFEAKDILEKLANFDRAAFLEAMCDVLASGRCAEDVKDVALEQLKKSLSIDNLPHQCCEALLKAIGENSIV